MVKTNSNDNNIFINSLALFDNIFHQKLEEKNPKKIKLGQPCL